MSLLGRLEDLSLTDIIQIVFLSRRTGILEIIDQTGRHTVIFRHGLIVNASSPAAPDLGSYLVQNGFADERTINILKQTESEGVPLGTAIVEMNIMSSDDLAQAIRQHITAIMTPLMESRDGEFNFILSDQISPLEIEYDPQALFKEAGIPPAKLLGTEGEKIKPLRGLEESMRAGKELLRGASAGGPPAAAVEVPLRRAEPTAEMPFAAPPSVEPPPFGFQAEPLREPDSGRFGEIEEEDPFDLGAPSIPASPAIESLVGIDPAPLPLSSADIEQELGASGAIEEEPEPMPFPISEPPKKSRPSVDVEFRNRGAAQKAEQQDRNIVLFQRDPLVRVAAKRAFARRAMQTFQFGSLRDARATALDLLQNNRFFVTFLEWSPAEAETMQLMQLIKRRNRHLPVVIIDREADLRRRHDVLKNGADLYLTRPSEDHLQPALAEEQLTLFADELVLFAERAFGEWQNLAGELPDSADAGKALYQIAEKEKESRTFSVLKQFINEVSNPNDINQVTAMISRLAQEYLDRGALFAAATVHFVGLGGFGVTSEDMNDRARNIRIRRDVPSILHDVAEAQKTHRGKLRKQPGNVKLIESLGHPLPTEVAVFPIMDKGRVVGVLYGDNAGHHGAIENTSALEIFLSQAGFALQNAIVANAGRHGLE